MGLAELAAAVGPDLWLGAAVRRWGADHVVADSRAEFALGASMRMAIECDGTFAGYVALAQLQGGPAQLEFAVLPRCRGRALATSAARDLMARAGRRGIAVIETRVHADNVASMAVLRRLGFTPLPPSSWEPTHPAVWRWQGGSDASRV